MKMKMKLSYVFVPLGVGIVGYITRSIMGSNDRERLVNKLNKKVALDAFEIEELRSMNKLQPQLFNMMVNNLSLAFPNEKCSYIDFIQHARAHSNQEILNAHYLDRIILPNAKRDDNLFDIYLLSTALSLIVSGAVEDRLGSLFTIARAIDNKNNNDQNEKVSFNSLSILLQHLINTCQVPMEKCVLPDENRQYPLIHHTLAPPKEIVNKALEESHLEGCTKFTQGEFEKLLISKSICLWGECFKRRIQN